MNSLKKKEKDIKEKEKEPNEKPINEVKISTEPPEIPSPPPNPSTEEQEVIDKKIEEAWILLSPENPLCQFSKVTRIT